MIQNNLVKYRNILMIELKYLLHLLTIKEESERKKKERKREMLVYSKIYETKLSNILAK